MDSARNIGMVYGTRIIEMKIRIRWDRLKMGLILEIRKKDKN